jgi:hypothetical protein
MVFGFPRRRVRYLRVGVGLAVAEALGRGKACCQACLCVREKQGRERMKGERDVREREKRDRRGSSRAWRRRL